MVYILIFLFCSIYLYFVEGRVHNKNFISFFVILFPVFLVYWLPMAFQKGVGTDYYEYYNYFFNNDHIFYLEKKEFIYYAIVEFTQYLGIPQFQFILISFIQSLIFFGILFLLSKNGYNLWIFFLLFFLITGIYNNQMNGIRQFVAVFCLPVFLIFLHQKKYIKAIFFSFIAIMFHFSSILPLFFLLMVNCISKYFSNKIIIIIFIISPFFYLLNISDFVFGFMRDYGIFYSTYENSEYNQTISLSDMMLKFVGIPFFIIFLFIYWRDQCKNNLFDKFALVWSLTFFMFLLNFNFGMAGRLYIYFIFFSIFPMYYIFIKSRKIALLIVVYYFSFYFAKVFLFAKNEYLYSFNGSWL